RISLEVVDEIDSTSTRLMERATGGAPSGTCLAAEWQSAGRGRRGRTWISTLGGSLTFSLLWRFERGAGHLGGLSLAVGAAVARALSDCGVERVQVIGVGVNYRLAERVLERIDQPVTDVAQCSTVVPSRSALLAALLGSLA